MQPSNEELIAALLEARQMLQWEVVARQHQKAEAWCERLDALLARADEPQAEQPSDYSEMSREQLERHAARMSQALADDKPRAFYKKYALGQLAAPSCFCCGQVGGSSAQAAIRHLELPDIFICSDCVSKVRAEQRPGGQPETFEEAVREGLIAACIYDPATHDNDPLKAVSDLIGWNVTIALDPQVSSDAQALIDRGKAEALKAIEKLYDSPGPVAIVNTGMGGIEWLVPPLPDDTPLYAAPQGETK